MIYLKADTAVEILIGPAVAVGDGFTPVTTLTIASADQKQLIKHNGNLVLTSVTITDVLSALTAAVDGYYSMNLDATDTNTEGFLIVVIQDASLILPLRHEFMVVNANTYASFYEVAGSDILEVDVQQMNATTLLGIGTSGDKWRG